MQLALLEELKTEDMNDLSTHISAVSHDSLSTTCLTFSSVLHSDSSLSPSPYLHCQFYNISDMSSDSSKTSWNTQSEWTKVCLHENLKFTSGSSLPPSATPNLYCPSSLASPLLAGSISYSPDSNQKDSDKIGFSDSHIYRQKEEDERNSSVSLQLDENIPSFPSPLVLDSCKLDQSCPTLAIISLNPSISVCQSVLSSQLHHSDGLIPTAELDRLCSSDDNTDPAPITPIQDVTLVNMNLSLDIQDTLQKSKKQEGGIERHTDTVQTREAESTVGLSEGSTPHSLEVCSQTERDPQIPFCCLDDEFSVNTKHEEFRKVCQVGMNDPENAADPGLWSHGSTSVVEVPEVHNKTEMKPIDLIEAESLDLVFETSVDGSDSEYGDVDAFFQQLDREGRVYWAEPIQVSNATPVSEESGSFEASDGSARDSLFLRDLTALDSLLSTGNMLPLSSSTIPGVDKNSRKATAFSDISSSLTPDTFPSLSTPPNVKSSSSSVSVQMPSFLSSHIVHRKDVPYMTESKHTPLLSVHPLDTSTPFRAVQSWTDLQIQRNAITKKVSQGVLDTVPNEVTVSRSTSETTQPLMISSSPSCPLLSNDWQSHDSIREMAENDGTISLDQGLSAEKQEVVDRNGNEDETRLWESKLTATMACWCPCDCQCSSCTQKTLNKQHTLGNILYSLDELEEMMVCLQQFRSVLSNMEEQLSEDQAAVYSALSDKDRENVRDIEELRYAVKQEAGELEVQLNELAHHYDESLKMKMHRLLDEQSLLCSQLRVFLPRTVPSSSSSTPKKSVATQCCLLPCCPSANMHSAQVSPWSTWKESPAGSVSICQGLGGHPTKTDKLDIVGLFHRLKKSLHHSVNTDSLD